MDVFLIFFIILILVAIALIIINDGSRPSDSSNHSTNLFYEIYFDVGWWYGKICAVENGKIIKVYDSHSFGSREEAEQHIKAVFACMKSKT